MRRINESPSDLIVVLDSLNRRVRLSAPRARDRFVREVNVGPSVRLTTTVYTSVRYGIVTEPLLVHMYDGLQLLHYNVS